MLDAARGDLDRVAIPGAGAGEIAEQGGGIQVVQGTAQHQLGLADPSEQRGVEAGQVAEAPGEGGVDEDAHGEPGNRLGLADRNGNDFPGAVLGPEHGARPALAISPADEARETYALPPDGIGAREHAAVRIEEHGEVHLRALPLGRQDGGHCGFVVADDRPAEEGICGEHRAGGAQPGVTALRELDGDRTGAFQETPGPHADLAVCREQHGGDGAQLRDDHQQGRQAKDLEAQGPHTRLFSARPDHP